MDKQEYKTIIEQMKNHMSEGQYQEAVELAEGINWRKVHNVNRLVDAADAYEAVGKIDEAKELLVLAHERSPIGRTIIYKLAMLCLKKNDVDGARKYLEKFVEIAPKDSHKYILKYHILKAGNASDDSIIKVLEQLKEADFMEEWGYELACMYRKNGMINECVRVCDDLILWFGEGPYVESALELKMIYTPLDKSQEDKYRHFQQKRDGITEIMANEELASGEIISHTVAIPSIELPQETFNTVNLQAEIKKNIDEIMKATEAGEVNENMVAIMNLVEEIPYLRAGAPDEEPVTVAEKPSINEVFKDYLKEEYSGQMSIVLPEDDETDSSEKENADMAGQMTIEEVLSEWERTRHAAELALEDAKKAELEEVKAKALKDANFVLNRLEEAIPKLDAGVSPNELLKEEYLSSSGNVVTKVNLSAERYKPKELFSIPVLNATGDVAGGVQIPVVHVNEEAGKIISGKSVNKGVDKNATTHTTTWEPPKLKKNNKNAAEDAKAKAKAEAKAKAKARAEEEARAKKAANESMVQAADLLADVNQILQAQIDRVSGTPDKALAENNAREMDQLIVKATAEGETLSAPTGLTAQLDVNEIARIMNEAQQTKVDKVVEDIKATAEEETVDIAATEATTAVTAEIEESVEAVEPVQVEEPESAIENDIPMDDVDLEPEDEELPTVESVLKSRTEPEESAPAQEVQEQEVHIEPKKDFNHEMIRVELNADDIKIFTYFMQIKGMQDKIEDVLSGTISSIFADNISGTGNILITGNKGTGKTKLATSFVKSIQRHTEQIGGSIGKIDGARLNDKDILDLFSKISGGTLIVENASGMNKETAAMLSLVMSQEKEPTLVILEDTNEGINKTLTLEPSFVQKFSQRISIPVFTIDELVEFGKTYASDKNCVIDEMAVLALYNRINLIGTYDHPTSISEVAEIMEEAIDNATSGGLFRKKTKTDKEGRRIIREKDFEE